MNEFAAFLLTLSTGWLVYRIVILFTASQDDLSRSLGIDYPADPLVSLESISSSSVSLHWTYPEKTSVLKRFVVNLNNEISQEVAPEETGTTLTNLASGTVYTIRVYAINEQDLTSHATPITVKTKYKDASIALSRDSDVDHKWTPDHGGNQQRAPNAHSLVLNEDTTVSACKLLTSASAIVTPEQEARLIAMRAEVEMSNAKVHKMQVDLEKSEKYFAQMEDKLEGEIENLRQQHRDLDNAVGRTKTEVKTLEHQKSQAEIIKAKIDRGIAETKSHMAKINETIRDHYQKTEDLKAQVVEARTTSQEAQESLVSLRESWKLESKEWQDQLYAIEEDIRRAKGKVSEMEAAASGSHDSLEITSETPLPGDEEWAQDQMVLARTYEEKFRLYHEVQAQYNRALEAHARSPNSSPQMSFPATANPFNVSSVHSNRPEPSGMTDSATDLHGPNLFQTNRDLHHTFPSIPQHRYPPLYPMYDPDAATTTGTADETNAEANSLLPSHLLDSSLQSPETRNKSDTQNLAIRSLRSSPDSSVSSAPSPVLQNSRSPLGYPLGSSLGASSSAASFNPVTSSIFNPPEPTRSHSTVPQAGQSRRFPFFSNRNVNPFKNKNTASNDSPPAFGSLGSVQTRSLPRKSSDLAPIGTRPRTASVGSAGNLPYPSARTSEDRRSSVFSPSAEDSRSRYLSLPNGGLSSDNSPSVPKVPSTEALPLPQPSNDSSRSFGWPKAASYDQGPDPWHFGPGDDPVSRLSSERKVSSEIASIHSAERESSRLFPRLNRMYSKESKESNGSSAKSVKSRVSSGRGGPARMGGFLTFFRRDSSDQKPGIPNQDESM